MPRLTAAPPSPPRDASPIRVLVVDDDEAVRRLLLRVLRSDRFRVASAADGPSAIAHVAKNEVDVALVDLTMPGMDGIEVLGHLKTAWPNLSVILMTAFADVDVAVKAMKGGAFYFFSKPFQSNEAVAAMVEKACEHRRLQVRARELESALQAREPFGEIVGASAAMQAVYRVIEGVAATTSTVLVLGESGTGKELVARAIHSSSPRAALPLAVVNCGALPKDLVEAELFGHARGAFTGADVARPGLFESANGGTVFLDEIADLPLAAQVKLLRTLQNGEVRRIGSNETRTVNVRVIAATNVDLAARMEAGAFRQDLFYRLNVIAIELPPLRERREDVLPLARYFLCRLARRMARPDKRLSPGAEEAIEAYAWPGNVRELEHAMERAYVLSSGDILEPSDLPFAAIAKPATGGVPLARRTKSERPERATLGVPESLLSLPFPAAKRKAAELFEEAYLGELLRRSEGNRSLAARRAGLDPANLRRVLRRKRSE
jgi:DNA-binding NtrC family response regulator